MDAGAPDCEGKGGMMVKPNSDQSKPARVVVDVQQFKEAVWAVERENFRPGNALDALDRATIGPASDEEQRR